MSSSGLQVQHQTIRPPTPLSDSVLLDLYDDQVVPVQGPDIVSKKSRSIRATRSIKVRTNRLYGVVERAPAVDRHPQDQTLQTAAV